ncbi:cell division protein FtsQ/DivIB [Salibacterium aidingense]|uniref:cell division protein FtsQ/DivIB n=1 Tax=Salibacterium aidingense TaxID=384933 RepID=UPI003BC91CA8
MADKKVVTMDDKIPAMKEKRKKRTNRRLIMYLSIFFILIFLVIYFQSPLSHIRNIQVKGTVHLDSMEVAEKTGIKEGVSIWRADLSEAEEKVMDFEEIDNVSISRTFPSTIRVEVTEYPRMAYVENGTSFVPVLQNGKVLEEETNQELPADAPVLRSFQDMDKLRAFAEELSKLGEGVLNRISEVIYQPTEEDGNAIRLYMNDGIEVESSIRNFAEYMSSYPSVAKEVDKEAEGILHMKMSPYFESTAEKTEEDEEENVEEE